jgi:transcriptional regulator with XRE-family HTH domain
VSNPKLGARLKRERIRAGYGSQSELAKAMGVERGAVGNWESGDRPSMANAEGLALRLGVDRIEMLSRYGYPIGGGVTDTAELSPAFRAAINAAVAEALAASVPEIAAQVTAALSAQRPPPPPRDPGAGGGPHRQRPGGSPR